MKNTSLKIKILSGVITGGMLLSSVSTAFAATGKPLTNDVNATSKSECRQKCNKRQQDLETNLKKLVTDKTLTQDQSNKINDAIVKDRTAKKANFEKTKGMTKEQRKTYMINNKINHINPLKSIVDNGTITQAQADKVGFGHHHHHHGTKSSN